MDKKTISKRFLSVIVVAILSVALVIPGVVVAAPEATATRTLPASVGAGANFVVGIEASGCGAFGQVLETLPSGFSYVSTDSTDVTVTEEDGEVKFTFMGDSVSFDYTVTASTTAGTYNFSGIVKDEDKVQYAIGGDTNITVGAPAEGTSATRTLPASVGAGANFDVGIEASGCGAFGQVVETLPAGFSYVSTDSTDVTVTEENSTVKFTFIGDSVSFDYTVTASTTAGTYNFSGIVKDEDTVEYAIGGDSDITVGAPALALESIAASPSSVSLDVGDTEQLTITATYSDASTDDVTTEASYVSDDETVATVSGGGLITAVAGGSATVTASYTEDAITKTAEVSVTVSMLAELEFSGSLAKDERETLLTPDIPEGATELEITLSATADIDLELYDGAIFVIGWKAIIDSSGSTTGTYEGDTFAYSGWYDGEEYITADGPLSRAYTLKVFGYEAGDYTVTVSYVPAAPPNPPPTIIIDVPATVTLGNPVTVAVSATDPDGVAMVEFMVSSPWPEEWSPASSNSQWVMSFDDEATLTFVPGWAGTYTVEAWAYDELGNSTPQATPVTTTFVVAE